MDDGLSDNVWRVLRCPSCGGHLERAPAGATCSDCRVEYSGDSGGPIDLRLKTPKTVSLDFVLATPPLPQSGFDFGPLEAAPDPEVDFTGVSVPRHLTKELMSHFPKGGKGQMLLDLGCGTGIHRDVCERAAFEYVGIDYGSREAMIAADAHALPFAAESFDAILSIAVLEHIRYPAVMMREACRVLKTGGRLIGTVAFLEPFHSDSYYHHSHLGTINSLQDGGFHIDRIAPSEQWSALVAQSQMGLLPKMPKLLARALVLPVMLLHRLWWRVGHLVEPKADQQTRIRNLTGALTFIAAKHAR
jgi:SAM-dependent methyltransferase